MLSHVFAPSPWSLSCRDALRVQNSQPSLYSLTRYNYAIISRIHQNYPQTNLYLNTLPMTAYQNTLLMTAYQNTLPMTAYQNTLPMMAYLNTLPMTAYQNTLPMTAYTVVCNGNGNASCVPVYCWDGVKNQRRC